MYILLVRCKKRSSAYSYADLENAKYHFAGFLRHATDGPDGDYIERLVLADGSNRVLAHWERAVHVESVPAA